MRLCDQQESPKVDCKILEPSVEIVTDLREGDQVISAHCQNHCLPPQWSFTANHL